GQLPRSRSCVRSFAEPAWPYAPAPWGYDAVRIDGVLQLLMEAPKGVVVEAVGVGNVVLIDRRRAVIAPAMFGRDRHDLLHRAMHSRVLLRIAALHGRREDQLEAVAVPVERCCCGAEERAEREFLQCITPHSLSLE